MNRILLCSLTLIVGFFTNINYAQVINEGDFIPGTICRTPDCSDLQNDLAKFNSPQNGNGSIATSYTVSGCGLDFVTVSVRLNKRSFGCCGTGVSQPAPITVSGMPACITSSNIVRALLYSGASGSGIAVTATIKNSLNVTQNYPMTIIGSHNDKCWGYAGTYNYRADVTSIIIGNGSYTISGLPTNPPTAGNDTDGATLFIIYRDPSQTFSGHFVIADGCIEGSGSVTSTISGFNVCGVTNTQKNFMIVSDLQKSSNVPFKMNSAANNYTLTTAMQDVWNYIQNNVAVAASGQTTASFGLTTSGDCWNVVAAGMYYRTTCLACTAGPCTVLPIELTKFETVCMNNLANINWETSTEKNNDFFTLMRSEDGIIYHSIATVSGSGNSTVTKHYSYLDKSVEPGRTYYYKLLQTDFDKTENYSGSIVFANCQKKDFKLEVFPNPASEEVYLLSETNLTDVTIEVADGFGKKFIELKSISLKKNEKFIINVRNLLSGCYQLTISNSDEVIQKKMVTYK